MATEVPYTGAPQIPARLEPTSSVNVVAGPAAFGVNVAESLSHLGAVQEGAGKELFDRAYAMQELHEHSVANSALADAQDKGNQLFVDLRSKEGINAVDGYKGFLDNLNQIREAGGKNLSPYAQQLYDQESRNSRQRLAFAGAVWAADQGKQYTVGASVAREQSAMKEAEFTGSEASYAAAVDTIKKETAFRYGSVGGKSPDEVAFEVKKAVNTTLLDRIVGMARRGNPNARVLLKDGITKGDIFGADVDKVTSFVDQRMSEVGSRVAAGNVAAGNVPLSMPVTSFLKDRMQGGVHLEGTNPLFANLLQSALEKAETATGEKAAITSLHRDSTTQAVLYQNYLSGKGGLAAPPGTSYHEVGEAADLQSGKILNWLHQHPEAHPGLEFLKGRAGLIDSGHIQIAGGKIDPSAAFRAAPLSARLAAGEQEAERIDPGNERLREQTTARIETQYRREKYEIEQTEFDNSQVLWGKIISGETGGQPITSPEQLMADPKTKDAWEYLQKNKPQDLERFLNEMRSNANGPKADTPERQQTYRTLYGMAHSDQNEFMKATEDLSKLDLSSRRKDDVMRMRAAVQKGSEADPKVTNALSILYPLLQAADLKKGGNEEGRNLFISLLGDQMEQFQTDNKRPMKYDEIKTIGAQMLQEMGGGGWFGGHGTPWFETITSVPPEEDKIIRNNPYWAKAGITPSDQQVLQAYIGAVYREKFGPKKESAR